MEQEQPIILFELEGCPYCAKVISKLEELGLEYESTMVPADHSERDSVRAVTGGPTGVPVIQDPNTDEFEWLNESDDIVEYLESTYGSN